MNIQNSPIIRITVSKSFRERITGDLQMRDLKQREMSGDVMEITEQATALEDDSQQRPLTPKPRVRYKGQTYTHTLPLCGAYLQGRNRQLYPAWKSAGDIWK
jgi:hypothetical protein